MAKLTKQWIGNSVSYATLQEKDLIRAFEEVLDLAGVEYERPAAADKVLLGQALTCSEWAQVGSLCQRNSVATCSTALPRRHGVRPSSGRWL